MIRNYLLPMGLLRTAIHEAGHTVVASKSEACIELVSVDILSTNGRRGNCQTSWNTMHPMYAWQRIAHTLARAAAEKVCLGNYDCSGLGGDFKASAAILDGQSLQLCATSHKFSVKIPTSIIREALYEIFSSRLPRETQANILNRCHTGAIQMVQENRPALDRLVISLLRNRQLVGTEIHKLLTGQNKISDWRMKTKMMFSRWFD